jgi:serine/threonine-protein kinase
MLVMAVKTQALPPRYSDAQRIASGGMADVYAAEDTELGRKVAIKVLATRFAEDEEIRERFKREALTAARLSGKPHVVTIFDVGEWEGSPFIVMELLEGGTVAERVKAGAVDRGQAIAWLGQAAVALDAAHAERIVHRDVKPGNFLLDDGDELYVADFGIARVLDEAAGGVTVTGTILGTAGYLSPEQAQGQKATPVSDVYGLAVVAYELLTGVRPFERPMLTAEAAAHVHEPPPPPSERADLPVEVDAVFARALAKDPAYRYPSAQALVDDLVDALEGVPPTVVAAPAEAPTVALRRRRRPKRAILLPSALAALLLATGGLAAVFLTSGESGVTTPQRSTPLTHPQTAPPAQVVLPPPPVKHGKGKKKGHHKGKHKGFKKHEKGDESNYGTPVQVTPPPATTPPATTEGTTTEETTTQDTTTTPTATDTTTSAVPITSEEELLPR